MIQILRTVDRRGQSHEASAGDRWSHVWRWTVIALGALILCSCRGPATPPAGGPLAQNAGYPALPPEAFSAAPAAYTMPLPGPPGMEQGVPLPYSPQGPWRPPGIAGPWPQDEYVCDGGNSGPPIRVGKDWDVRGLAMEDTVAHYDTLDGRTLVEPSNQTCVYAPRFGAVRQVVNVHMDQQQGHAAGMYLPTKVVSPRTSDQVAVNQVRQHPVGEVGQRPARLVRTRQAGDVVSSKLGPRGFDTRYQPYENIAVIRNGMFVETEGPLLAKGVQAAIAWTRKQAVQIILDRQSAAEEVSDRRSESVYTVGSRPGRPRLRVIKVASTPFAEPGDQIDFTIRFDNIGDQPIGNVVLLDSLNTRLEMIPGSAQCSLDAQFSTQPNEGDSVIVRCEVTNPLRPGEGGVLRFRCLVR